MSGFGAFMWNELNSTDVEAAKRFYEKVLGWTAEDMPTPDGQGTYVMLRRGEEQVGGMMDLGDLPGVPEGTPSHWFSYVKVEDAQATCDAASGAGGAVVRAPFEIKGIGWIAILRASDGSHFGIMQPTPEDCPADE